MTSIPIRPTLPHAPNTGAAVAGILELEATIRIPHEVEGSQVPSSLNPIAEEFFDLARYFSIKSPSHNDVRNRRTTWTDDVKDVKPISTNTGLGGQSVVFENDEDYPYNTVIEEFSALPQTVPFSQTQQNETQLTSGISKNTISSGDSWLYPFHPLSESNRIDEK